MTDAEGTIGLCVRCLHARRVENRRGSAFWRCGRAALDPRFARYPRLPVLSCPGFEATAPYEGEDR
jgi:hypothetical protein